MAVSLQLAFHKAQDWGAMALEHAVLLSCCSPEVMLVVPGELCSREQQHHGAQISFLSSFVTHAKSISLLLRSLEADLSCSLPSPLLPHPSIPALLWFPPSPLGSPSLSLRSPSLSYRQGENHLLPALSRTLWGTPVSSRQLAADFICPQGMVFIRQQSV